MQFVKLYYLVFVVVVIVIVAIIIIIKWIKAWEIYWVGMIWSCTGYMYRNKPGKCVNIVSFYLTVSLSHLWRFLHSSLKTKFTVTQNYRHQPFLRRSFWTFNKHLKKYIFFRFFTFTFTFIMSVYLDLIFLTSIFILLSHSW